MTSLRSYDDGRSVHFEQTLNEFIRVDRFEIVPG